MKRRKNPIYKGQSNRVSTGTGDRLLVDAFYVMLNDKLYPEDEIEIIPPEQVNPTHDLHDQVYIMVDYCVRKILSEATGLYRWGNEVTPRLRALAPVVDQETAEAARTAARDAEDVAAGNAHRVTQGAPARVAGATTAAYAVYDAANAAAEAAALAADAATEAAHAVRAAYAGARCVYQALVACISADHEGAYNRIIELTNEMLESL